jgi:hypothetical protein
MKMCQHDPLSIGGLALDDIADHVLRQIVGSRGRQPTHWYAPITDPSGRLC